MILLVSLAKTSCAKRSMGIPFRILTPPSRLTVQASEPMRQLPQARWTYGPQFTSRSSQASNGDLRSRCASKVSARPPRVCWYAHDVLRCFRRRLDTPVTGTAPKRRMHHRNPEEIGAKQSRKPMQRCKATAATRDQQISQRTRRTGKQSPTTGLARPSDRSRIIAVAPLFINKIPNSTAECCYILSYAPSSLVTSKRGWSMGRSVDERTAL